MCQNPSNHDYGSEALPSTARDAESPNSLSLGFDTPVHFSLVGKIEFVCPTAMIQEDVDSSTSCGTSKVQMDHWLYRVTLVSANSLKDSCHRQRMGSWQLPHLCIEFVFMMPFKVLSRSSALWPLLQMSPGHIAWFLLLTAPSRHSCFLVTLRKTGEGTPLHRLLLLNFRAVLGSKAPELYLHLQEKGCGHEVTRLSVLHRVAGLGISTFVCVSLCRTFHSVLRYN